jgi:hypothetical protein
MIRLRQGSALLFALVLAPALRAQDKPASPWAIDRSLTVSPQGAPVPALKYRLLPLRSELKPGNAVPIYLRLVFEQSDAARKYRAEAPLAWNRLPVDEIPLGEARKFLQTHRHSFLRQLEVGARRRTAAWNYTIEEPNPIGMLLPDLQTMRSYVPALVLQVRVALAEGDFSAAAHHLETGFAFSRHAAEGPTFIHSMVGIALAWQFAGTVGDFVERPGAPNLYWSLAALPRPLIDVRGPLEWEYRMVEQQIPGLGDLDRERTAEQWDAVLRRVRTELRELVAGLGEGSPLRKVFAKGCAPGDPAAKSPDLPAARRFVARSKGLPAARVEAMPPAHVLLLYMAGTYQEDRDNWYRAAYLPYPQANLLLAASRKWLRDQPVTEGHTAARLFLPGLDRVLSNQIRLERNLAALRVIEALRMYAAAHDGKLPDKLGDVTEVPLPTDPGTGRPFEYRREGDTATLVSQVPGDPLRNNGLRYRVTIRKK